MGRIDEVALKVGADIGREDAIEEGRELEAEWSGVGQEANNGRGDDERGKERDHGGVGGRLRKVEAVVPHGADNGSVEDAGKTQEASHGVSPWIVRDAPRPSTA